MSELLANPKICGACNKPGCSLKCACKLVFYCGEECQRAHWPTHKKDCRLALAKKVKDAKREHWHGRTTRRRWRWQWLAFMLGLLIKSRGGIERRSSATWRLAGYIWRSAERAQRGIQSLLLFL